MRDQRRVVLIGHSLLMDGVAASLRRHCLRHVTQIGQHSPALESRIESLAPDIVILDLAIATPDSILWLLKRLSEVYIVAIDPGCSRTLVMVSTKHIAPTMDSLMSLVEGSTRDLAENEA
jgi:DNA-binding NarL/FixJ family response regulator